MAMLKSIIAAAIVAIGALSFGSVASQAASIPSAAGITGQDNLVHKTHGYHRGWRRGHRHARRWRRFRWHRLVRPRQHARANRWNRRHHRGLHRRDHRRH
jgi:hypothetical protein